MSSTLIANPKRKPPRRKAALAELAKVQRVKPVRGTGEFAVASDPDPAEAEWLARQLRVWRADSKHAKKPK
jgi:hypothetical protein